jgi:signal transduction histidine kinase
MQIYSKEVFFLIGLTSLIFLIAPLFLIIYVISYNRRKKKHHDEKIGLKQEFENELLKTQMEVQEQTLKTIAYDLHDNIGQLLSITSITLSSIDVNNHENTAEKIVFVEDLTARSIKEVKALSRMLHGEELVNRGLGAAIEFELEWLQRSDKFKIHFDQSRLGTFDADSSKQTIVFRLFQEIINNIIQHAQASEIFITLEQINNALKLTIRDNGVGFNVDETLKRQTGMGLHNIKKRAAMINGTASINSEPGTGSIIVVTIPY